LPDFEPAATSGVGVLPEINPMHFKGTLDRETGFMTLRTNQPFTSNSAVTTDGTALNLYKNVNGPPEYEFEW